MYRQCLHFVAQTRSRSYDRTRHDASQAISLTLIGASGEKGGRHNGKNLISINIINRPLGPKSEPCSIAMTVSNRTMNHQGFLRKTMIFEDKDSSISGGRKRRRAASRIYTCAMRTDLKVFSNQILCLPLLANCWLSKSSCLMWQWRSQRGV